MEDRIDYVVSNWIFVWFILYYFKFINFPNPKFALIIGLFLCIPVIIVFIHKNKFDNFEKIFPFIIFILITKAFPLFLIRKDQVSYKDVIAFGLVIVINFLYVTINTGSIYNAYNIIKNRINNGIIGEIDGSITN